MDEKGAGSVAGWTCPICGGEAVARVRPYPSCAAFLQNARLVTCGTCLAGSAWPLPEAVTLRQANATYWTDLQDDDSHARALYAAQACYRMRYLRSRIRGLDSMRILDVGAGQGHVFDNLRTRVGRASYTAVEADTRMCDSLRRKGVVEVVPSLEEVTADDFDLVILSHVIEHVRDPVGLVRRAAGRLRAGGAVFVEVPNRDDRYKADLGPHLFVFAPKSLTHMFALLGMPVEELVTCGVPVLRGEDDISDEAGSGGVKSWIKQRVPGALSVKRSVEAAFLSSRLGRARLNAQYGFGVYETDGPWLRCIARR